LAVDSKKATNHQQPTDNRNLTMTPELIIFIVLALVSVAAGLGMLFSKNAIYAAIFLIMNFVTVAIFYLILGGAFIAVAQIAVYAGAIMVLFLFVIMLLGAEKLGQDETMLWQKPLAILLGIILAVETVYVLFFQAVEAAPSAALPEGFGSPASFGWELFNQYLLPFEVTSVLLLVAMIGAIVLTRQEKKR
jgi:NADH-quinone oxidoreductase subunit J